MGRRASTVRRLPGPLRRLLRERSRLLAVVLLAVVAVTASGVQSAATTALQGTLDTNWRGLYDILVTASDQVNELDGLLPPNSLASNGSPLSPDDVTRIRAVPGIEVAAPIGEVIVPGLKPAAVTITLPKDATDAVSAKKRPQAFRVTLTYTTNDGLGERFVASKTHSVVIDLTPRTPDPMPKPTECSMDDMDVDMVKYPHLCGQTSEFVPFVSYTSGGGTWGGNDDTVDNNLVFNLGTAPQTSTRITLVDPVAEQQLLGDAGAFLDPFITMNPGENTSSTEMSAWAANDTSQFGADFLRQQQERVAMMYWGFSPVQIEELKQLYADNGRELAAEPPATYVPLLVSKTGPAPLTAQLEVEAFGSTTEDTEHGYGYVLPPALTDGGAGTVVGTTTTDVTSVLNPFVQGIATAPWPGTPEKEIASLLGWNSLQISQQGSVGGTNFVDATSDGEHTSVRLTSEGFKYPIPSFGGARPTDPFALENSGTKAGRESVYASATNLVHSSDIARIGVPVGTFATDDVRELQSTLGFVPLGAYEQVGSTLVAGSSAAAVEPVAMRPSVTGLGLVSPETVAIASISSAATWGQSDPVNAVRVRVAGIDSYTDAAMSKVVEVARALEELGFTATIVAGTSPNDVTVTVDNYAFGVPGESDAQVVGPLGDVTQLWSEFGAAARAHEAVSFSNIVILGIALGSTAFLLAAVQFVSVPRRRSKATVLRQMGWTRARILRWMAAEEIPAALVVGLAGLLAVVASGFGAAATGTALIGFATVAVTSACAVGFGARARGGRTASARTRVPRGGVERHRRRLRLRGRSTWAFGVRQSVVHRLTSSTHILATVIVAISAAMLAIVFFEGRAAAGTSLIGEFTTAQALLPQMVLGLTGIAAGVVLAVIGRRVDLDRRANQWEAMRAMGWTHRELNVAWKSEAAAVGVPAVALGMLGALGFVSWLEAPQPEMVLAIAAIAAVLSATVVLFVRRKAGTQ